jgi:hypothetical protein
MTLLNPVWEQPKPSFDEAQVMCSHVGLAFDEARPDSLMKALESLRESHSNGGAVFASFCVADSRIFDWFASRNRLAEFEILPSLLRREEVRVRLPELQIPADASAGSCSRSCSIATVDGFKMDSPFLFDGHLARTLYAGGAYTTKSRLDAKQTKQLALAVCDDLFEQRFSEITLFNNYDAWTPWFHGIAWDWTAFLFDRRKRTFSILAVTDTD